MAANDNVERSLMKTFSLDGNFIFSNKCEASTKHESFTEKPIVDPERYGNQKHNKLIFKNHSNERHKVPIETLERERSERSQGLEEAWTRVKKDVLENREDASMQTEDFIPSDEAFTTKDAVSQTDAFEEQHILVTDALNTVDEGTQLSKGELVDFDTEVEPILEELVAPIIEEALLEVMEEEQQLDGHFGRSRFKDKPTTVNAELRSAWSSFQEEMNEELMVSVLANNYVDDVLSSIYGLQSNESLEEIAVKEKNKDYVQNFLPWFVAEIDYELEMLQQVYENLKIDLEDAIRVPVSE